MSNTDKPFLGSFLPAGAPLPQAEGQAAAAAQVFVPAACFLLGMAFSFAALMAKATALYETALVLLLHIWALRDGRMASSLLWVVPAGAVIAFGALMLGASADGAVKIYFLFSALCLRIHRGLLAWFMSGAMVAVVFLMSVFYDYLIERWIYDNGKLSIPFLPLLAAIAMLWRWQAVGYLLLAVSVVVGVVAHYRGLVIGGLLGLVLPLIRPLVVARLPALSLAALPFVYLLAAPLIFMAMEQGWIEKTLSNVERTGLNLGTLRLMWQTAGMPMPYEQGLMEVNRFHYGSVVSPHNAVAELLLMGGLVGGLVALVMSHRLAFWLRCTASNRDACLLVLMAIYVATFSPLDVMSRVVFYFVAALGLGLGQGNPLQAQGSTGGGYADRST
ncbi:MAG TPA: hypothetical protein VNJ47_05825 [Nevskiales bacterium]|nr:hypothetical protein [Nevskiales bacterium]